MKVKKILKYLIGMVFYNFFFRYVKPLGNRVLIYHAFGSKLAHDSYGISIDLNLFEEHLVFLKKNYVVLPISDNTFSNELGLNSVSISIDDGYKDNLLAVKLLEKYQLPYTIYIATGFVGNEQYLTQADLENLSRSIFCTLGAHSINHVYLSKIDEDKQYEELYNSKIFLENIIGKEVKDFSYPYGDYDASSKNIAESLYGLISTSHIGINSVNQNRKMIKRIEIVASDDVVSLKKKIDGYYDFLGYL